MPRLQGVGDQVAVREHDALGGVGGAPGVDDRRQVAGGDGHIRRLVIGGCQQVVEEVHAGIHGDIQQVQPVPLDGEAEGGSLERRQGIADMGKDNVLERRGAGRLQDGLDAVDELVELGQGDQEACPAVLHLADQLLRVGGGQGEDRHAARLECAVEAGDELRQVGQQQHHPLARLQTQGAQAVGEAVDLRRELAVADALALVVDRVAGGEAAGGGIEQVMQGHARHGDGVGHAIGVVRQPRPRV